MKDPNSFEPEDFKNCKIYRADSNDISDKSKKVMERHNLYFWLTVVGLVLIYLIVKMPSSELLDLMKIFAVALFALPIFLYLTSFISVYQAKHSVYCYMTLKVLEILPDYYSQETYYFPFRGCDVETGHVGTFYLESKETYDQLKVDETVKIYQYISKREAEEWNIEER